MSIEKFSNSRLGGKPESNGSRRRPLSLKVSKDSHPIHKPSSSCSCSCSGGGRLRGRQRRPVIIYMQPAKLIHAQPSDFARLVHKLTGFSPADDNEIEIAPSNPEKVDCDKKLALPYEEEWPPPQQMNHDDRSNLDAQLSSTVISHMPDLPNLYLNNIALLTSNSMNFPSWPGQKSYLSTDAGNPVTPTVQQTACGRWHMIHGYL